MQYLVKKFKVKAGGKIYSAGEIVELPEKDADEILKGVPDMLDPIDETVLENIEEDGGEIVLNAMTVAELKELAAEHDIDLGTARNKADIIAVLTATDAEDADETEDAELPETDPAEALK